MIEPVRRPALALAILVPAPTLGALAGLWLLPGPVGMGLWSAAKVWLLLMPLAWTTLVDRRLPRARPLSARGIGVGAALGAALACAVLAAFIAVSPMLDAAGLRQTAAAAGFATPARYLALAAYLTIVNALLEEYVWRWFVYRACASLGGLRGPAAVALSAALFTLHHVVVLAAYFPPAIVALGAAGVFAGGAAWSWCFHRFGSLLPGYVSHAIVDIAVLAAGWMLLFGQVSPPV